MRDVWNESENAPAARADTLEICTNGYESTGVAVREF
jgi:hypothetical protein